MSMVGKPILLTSGGLFLPKLITESSQGMKIMLYIGITLITISIVWYLVHMEIYSQYLRKHRPEILDDSLRKRNPHKQGGKVTVIITTGQTPAWIMLFGLPPLPLFLIGTLLTVVALIVNAFR
jgi:hypothetical protein